MWELTKSELGNATKVVEIANELLKQKLTLAGTLNKRKSFISPEFLSQKRREEQESLFGFQLKLALVSHVSKRNKSVVLPLSMHNNKAVDEETKEPNIIRFYNSTNGGVDTLDHCIMSTTYST